MIQREYLFHTFEDLTRIVKEINASDEYKNAAGVLLQLNNPKVDSDDERIVDYINMGLEKARLIGMTAANVSDEEYDNKNNQVELNVTYFFDTALFRFEFDMERTSGFEAGLIVSEKLSCMPDAKCIQICHSCGSAIMHPFVREFRHHGLPIFGARAGRNVRAGSTTKVYGSTVHEKGVVGVIFVGKSLHYYMDNCFGFKEVGVEMTVTGTEGDNIITTVNHRPAVEVYTKYLGVKPGSQFMRNTCEFPLVFHRGKCVVARVPSTCREDGAINFTSDVTRGEKFRLSYGTPENLFKIMEKSVKRLSAFKPEAVFLFECANRVRLLKDRAAGDTEKYFDIAPNASMSVGIAEIFITPDRTGGALNSSLVAIGLTEDESAEDEFRSHIEFEDDSEEVLEGEEFIPFMDRILNLLERTSEELTSLNTELGEIAYTDRLTRVYNRWELENKLTDVLKMDVANDTNSSLVFMDIDHFKRVNDNYGHDVGDLVLRATVQVIKDNLESSYVFGRWGGEEFICILPETGLEEAAVFAEKLRKAIESNCFVAVQHITMSFGVTSSKPADDSESFVKRADEALYEAKETGRNKVVTRE